MYGAGSRCRLLSSGRCAYTLLKSTVPPRCAAREGVRGAKAGAVVLAVDNVSKRFGGVRAVDGCSFRIERGTITGLIGPNGAGKTTLFNIMAGFIRPTSGRVLLEGEDVTGEPPHRLFHRGLVRTFQIPHEFARMTVLENLQMGAQLVSPEHFQAGLDRVYDLFPRLRQRATPCNKRSRAAGSTWS